MSSATPHNTDGGKKRRRTSLSPATSVSTTNRSRSSSPIPAPVSSVKIIEDSDLYLEVELPGPEDFKKLLRVSSVVLCIASKVFKAMLDPNSPFAKGKSTHGLRQITLEENDYDALLLVMKILHLQHDDLPTTINIDRLYQIALICDKYDVATSVRVWAKLWCQPNTLLMRNFLKEKNYEKWLLISWLFQLEEIFLKVTGKLIREVGVDDDGKFHLKKSRTFLDGVPDSIVEAMSSLRKKKVTPILQAVFDQYKKYLAAAHGTKRICDDDCDAMTLGNLTAALVRMGNGSITENSTLAEKNSVEKTIQILGNLKCCDGPRYGSCGSGSRHIERMIAGTKEEEGLVFSAKKNVGDGNTSYTFGVGTWKDNENKYSGDNDDIWFASRRKKTKFV